MRVRHENYIHKKTDGWNLLIKESVARDAESFVRATGRPFSTPSVSRSVCHIITLPNGRRVFRKLLRHGGVLAPLFGGLFVSKRRVLRTLRTSERLRESGISAPAVLAVGWRTIVPPIYNLLIVTEWINAMPLSVALRGMTPTRRRRSMIGAAELLRSAFDHGVEQTDMHPDNILVDERGDLFLTDVESIRLHEGEVPSKRRMKVVLRLGRAVVKHALHPDAVSTTDMLRFLRSAIPDADASGLCATLKRDIRIHSLLWHRCD